MTMKGPGASPSHLPRLRGKGREEAAIAKGRMYNCPAHAGSGRTRRELSMTIKQALLAATAFSFATLAAGAPTTALAQQAAAVAAPAIDADDIGGIVRSRTGPESGVWV